jgi:hypothetical protein
VNVDPSLEKELQEQLDRLEPGEQQRVVNFARSLATKCTGVPGAKLIRFGGLIAQDELTLIQRAVEAGCEQVNSDDW